MEQRTICPSCDAKRSQIFAEHLHQNILLNHPHKHAVFTIPIRLRSYLMYDRELFSELYHAAWSTWNEYITSVLPGKTAAVMAVHSAGALLNWHPHIHCLLLAGTVDENNNFHPIKNIDTELLQEFFADKVFNFLLEKELITQDIVNSMKARSHSGFKLWLGEDIAPDNQEQRLFISRYLAKCPFALNRIEINDNPLAPTIHYYRDAEQREEHLEMSPLEFLARISIHIPRTHQRTTRFFGLYSYRSCGKKNREAKFKTLLENNFEPLGLNTAQQKPVSKYWAIWIKKVFEIDPLLCPKCGGNMKIRSFIHSISKIKKLCENLGIQDWGAPPPIGKNTTTYIDTGTEFAQ